MHALTLFREADIPKTILCLGAHSDDIEIGCGATIMRLRAQYPTCQFHWKVFSAAGVRCDEAHSAASRFAGPQLASITTESFQDGFLPYDGARVKSKFEELKSTLSPDLIFTHYRSDAHQDHRLLCELTWNTFRNHLILEYEIPKYDGDMGQPNLFAPLDLEVSERKVDHLLQSFPSQSAKPWFRRETFLALMRLRGMECNSPSGYAEAFYCHKMVV